MLSNPRNICLLTSQLLCAPALWQVRDQLGTAVRLLHLFKNAVTQKIHHQGTSALRNGASSHPTVSTRDWIAAVTQGADEHTASWKHTLVLGGLLSGLDQEDSITQKLRSERKRLTFELVSKVNSFLRSSDIEDALATTTISVVLCSVWSLVDHDLITTVDYDLLLPLLYYEPLFGKSGLHSGYFLSIIDNDIVQATTKKFHWSSTSETFSRLRDLSSSPLLVHLGPLSSFIAQSLARVRDMSSIQKLASDLVAFSRSFNLQWRHNKLSEVESNEETAFLTEQSIHETVPLLWQVMRTSAYAVIVILRSVMDRVLFKASVTHEIGK